MEPFRRKETLLGDDSEYRRHHTTPPQPYQASGHLNDDHSSSSAGRGLHGFRMLLRLLGFLLSGSIVTLLAIAINVRNTTREESLLNGQGTTPAWPRDLSLKPTLILLVAAGVTVLFSFLAIISSTVPNLSKNSPSSLAATAFTLTLTWAVYTTAIVYYKTWDAGKSGEWDLWTWSCKNKDLQVVPGSGYIDFKNICIEMTYVFWAAVGASVLEFVNLVLFIVVTVRSRRHRSPREQGSGGAGRYYKLANMMHL